MDHLISVIVPVYNVEQYLRRCVDSILAQTYKSIEVILVDDGSIDRCPIICDEYDLKDDRVIVIHKMNGGQSSARNAGLRIASGAYIAFVDSDDWIEKDTYEYCLDLLNNNDADYVQYGINITDSPQKAVINQSEETKVYDKKDVLQYYMLTTTQRPGGYGVWGGLYKRPLLVGLSFREGKIYEDMDFKYLALCRCKRMVVTNQKKYNYFQSIDSTTTSGLKQRDFDLRESANLLCQLSSNETYGTIAFLGRVKQARTAFSLLCKIAYFGVADQSMDKNMIVQELSIEHRRNVGTLLNAPLPFSRKLLAVLFAMSYKVTESIIRFARKFR